MPALTILIWLAFVFVIYYLFVHQRFKYKNSTISGAFFFEDDCLVLNTGVPYPIPFSEIEQVELHYNQRELDRQISYSLWVWVVKKDGKTKKVFYKGYRTAKLALPSDMKTALEEKGLRVVMVDQ